MNWFIQNIGQGEKWFHEVLTFNKVRFALGKVTKADDPIYLRMVLKNKLWLPCMYCLPTIIEYAKYQFIDVDAVQNLAYDMCSKM